MSYSPSLSLCRLKELKIWQGSYEDHIQKLSNTSNSEKNSSPKRETIFNTSIEKADMRDWDKREISPTKTFEQLLEEKIAEDEPIEVVQKPKRPFLKKGQGIARFRMNPQSLNIRKVEVVQQKKTDCQKQSTRIHERKGILKKPKIQFPTGDVDLTPLAVPDFVKPRGTWKSVFDSGSNGDDTKIECIVSEPTPDRMYANFRRSLDFKELELQEDTLKPFDDKHAEQLPEIRTEPGTTLNKSIRDKIKNYAVKRFAKDKLLSNDIPENLIDIFPSHRKKDPGDDTLEEQRLEKELKNFEVLEQRVENSSFCSTNTSVLNLLASTPQKNRTACTSIDKDIVFTNDRQDNIKLKLKEINEKTDVLRNFLMNLNKLDLNDLGQISCLDAATSTSEKSISTGTSFSDEDTRWSSRSPSLVDHDSEYDPTYANDSWKKIDIGINTSFESCNLNDTIKNEVCASCEELRLEVSEKVTNYNALQCNNNKLKSQLNEMEAKYEQVRKYLKSSESKHTEKVEQLKEEIEIERKKFAKERTYFENYVKDAQNRPTKKEREEIIQLKQELADVKELLKLKDSKNGATQARLRTQLKQSEKEITELKSTIEKLQKENSKLSMNQKYMRRPTEVKMLQEINKNLSKLTEETFKKKVSKSGRGDTDDIETEGELNIENIPENKENKHIKKSPKESEQKSISKRHRKSSTKTNNELDFISADNTSIEKQYEEVFGSFSSPRNSCSASLDKTENVLPDGTIEITYSNGNVKTVSSDGQIIKMQYFNGDTKETNLKTNIIKYHFAATDSLHIQYPDGSEVVKYPEGQTSKKFPDGRVEVSNLDGSLRVIHPDGSEEQEFADGRKTVKHPNGEQVIFLPNGQKEIHTDDYKRRQYPDGTVRTLYKDGSVETIYANGRVRLKDANGTLIMDTDQQS